MSWLGDLLHNDDPFLKLLIRIAFLLMVILIFYFAYAVISGKTIQLGSKNYGIVSEKDSSLASTDSSIIDSSILQLSNTDKQNILDTIKNNIDSNVKKVQIVYSLNDSASTSYGYALRNFLVLNGYEVNNIVGSDKINQLDTVSIIYRPEEAEQIQLIVGALDSDKRNYLFKSLSSK